MPQTLATFSTFRAGVFVDAACLLDVCEPLGESLSELTDQVC